MADFSQSYSCSNTGLGLDDKQVGSLISGVPFLALKILGFNLDVTVL